jgi:processive 1,2-diacylglycerol beta-glucosyltransferase
MGRPTVIILTAKFGSGHTQVANVLAKELERQGFSIVISDLFGESYPTVSHVTQRLFLKSFSHGPAFYKWFYYGTNKINHKGLLQFSQYLGRKRLLQLLEEHRPAFILNTFPLHVAPYLLKKSNLSIPVYTIITDYCVHPFWLNPLIDHYFVGSEQVKKAVIENGVDTNKITVSGIPIRQEFEKDFDNLSILRKHMLSPSKPVITIFAGSYGVLKGVKEICDELMQCPNYQIVVICGKNEELYRKLQSLLWKYPNRFRLYSYIEDIYELFSISSCIITKPGGITITEASALKIPLVFYRPVSGQEMENASYFVENGAAIITQNVSETIQATNRLMGERGLMEKMKSKLETIYHPQSASLITKSIIDYFEQKKISEGGK